MQNKRFDRQLHDDHDEFGRSVVKKFIAHKFGMNAQDNPDVYGVDLLLYKSDKIVGYAEVEVRNNWKTDHFPFDELNIPLRKKKFFQLDMPLLFFAVKNDGTRLLYCGKSVILSSEIKESKNKYVTSNEYFFKVPIEKMNMGIVSY